MGHQAARNAGDNGRFVRIGGLAMLVGFAIHIVANRVLKKFPPEDPTLDELKTYLPTPVIRILAAWKTVSYTTVTAVLTGVAVIAFGSMVYAQPGGGQGPPTKPVTVENPDTDPVPVSGAVTIGNLPAVLDVQVTNFPTPPGAKQRAQIAHVTLIGPGDNGFSAFDPGGPRYSPCPPASA